MTYRDDPVVPECPACGSVAEVRAHDNPFQGRWLAMRCMVLFDGTSAEWLRRPPERAPAREGLQAARAALREATER